MDLRVKHLHVGLVGLPGHGKDLFVQGLFTANNIIHKELTQAEIEKGLSRPFAKVVRLSLADRLREVATWISNEEMGLSMHHPSKDMPVEYRGTQLAFTRREWMIELGKFIEKKISSEWVKERTEADLQNQLDQIVYDLEWTTEPGVNPEESLQKALDNRLPELFITPDLRQEHQFDWVAGKPNGLVLKITDEQAPKRTVKKIDKLLINKPVVMTIPRSSFCVFTEAQGRKVVHFNFPFLKDLLVQIKELGNKTPE